METRPQIGDSPSSCLFLNDNGDEASNRRKSEYLSIPEK